MRTFWISAVASVVSAGIRSVGMMSRSPSLSMYTPSARVSTTVLDAGTVSPDASMSAVTARASATALRASTSAEAPFSVIELSGAEMRSEWSAAADAVVSELGGSAAPVVASIPATRPAQTRTGVAERKGRRGIEVLPVNQHRDGREQPAACVLGWARMSQVCNTFWTSRVWFLSVT